MRSSFVIASLLSLACAVNATNFTVKVGLNSTLTYTPTFVTDAVNGDFINFVFTAKNHTATQSSFADPCTHATGGFSSGFQPVNGTDLTVSYMVVNASTPAWFYCGQTNPISHCHSGMVFAVNPPATGNTFQAFQAEALALASSVAPSGTSTGIYASSTPSGTASGSAAPASTSSKSSSSAMKVGGSAAGTGALAVALLVGLAL